MDPREHPVHFTTLKAISKSPLHYLTALGGREDTAAMRLGRLVHTIVLGGPPSVVWNGDRRGKAWESFAEENAGREIVTQKEVAKVTAIANAVMGDPVAAPYLVGRTEHAVEWSMFGRKCATRGIDVLGPNWITDLKTTNCAEPNAFRRAALRMGYHAQLAMYRDAAASLGVRADFGIIVAVETAPPFAVTVHRLRASALDEGDKLLRLWFERLLACELTGDWPGYAQDVLDFEVNEDFGIVIDGDDVEVAA